MRPAYALTSIARNATKKLLGHNASECCLTFAFTAGPPTDTSAVEHHVAASTQNQALSAILFLYRHVLETKLPWLENVVRARKSTHVPVVLPRREVQALLAELEPPFHLIGQLLYGSGLRLMEALRLRVQDIDFEYAQIVVRDGKNNKDRVTILQDAAATALRAHLQSGGTRHELALKRGYAGVAMGHADVRTTQIYTHVMKKNAGAVKSPLD